MTTLKSYADGTVITSRVRLARNLSGYPFRVKNAAETKDIIKKVYRSLTGCDTFNLYYAANLSEIQLEAMKERYLISQALIDNKQFGAALINTDETLSVMVHEEDVIREQCVFKGLKLFSAYNRLDEIDNEIAKNLDIAFDDRLGYLTACPTNLGTGLRASVMMFLPALTESGKINYIIDEVEDMGLTVRGAYGEGSSAEGFTYQISNEVTLGLSELEILKMVNETCERIAAEETAEMEKLYGKRQLFTMDRTRKSFGILTNAVLLGYKEFLERIAEVKLGAMLGMINITDLDKIDELIIKVRPANLCENYGKILNATDRDLVRAEVVGRQLLKLKE